MINLTPDTVFRLTHTHSHMLSAVIYSSFQVSDHYVCSWEPRVLLAPRFAMGTVIFICTYMLGLTSWVAKAHEY